MISLFAQAVELLDAIGQDFMPWVAQYLVMKRASIEANFHTLYAAFVDHLKKPELLSMVIAETYRNIKVCSHIFVAEIGLCGLNVLKSVSILLHLLFALLCLSFEN